MRLRWRYTILSMAILLIVVAGFFRYNITRKILVNVSVFDLSAQVSDLNKWKHWNKLLFGNEAGKLPDVHSYDQANLPGDIKLKLHVFSPVSFGFEKLINEKKDAQYIGLKSVEADRHTEISWTVSENGFTRLVNLLTGKNEITDQLKYLKAFAESPSGLYGYPIKITAVTDPLLCLHRKVVASKNASDNIQPMVNNLNQYLLLNNTTNTKDYYYVSYFPVDGNIEIAIGMAINKDIPVRDGFDLLKFPVGGRLLVGEYNGTIANLGKLYSAMDKYVTDKKIRKVALPLEKYSANILDTDTVKMQLIYPIY